MYDKFGQFINGKWQKSSGGETYDVINPATEEIIGKASIALTTFNVDLTRLEDAFLAAIIPGKFGIFLKVSSYKTYIILF